jgi:hypothetical protein
MANDITKQRKLDFAKFGDLKAEYKTYQQDVHKDINDFIYNQGGRFEDYENYPNDGKRRDSKILNNTATIAHDTLTAGIYSGVTSPAIPFFRLTIDDLFLKEIKAVKEYFNKVTSIMLTDLTKGKFYTSAEVLYAELIAFGTAAIQVEADPETIFRFISYTIGEYYIDTDANGIVNYIAREFSMRARNVIDKFGIENVSDAVKMSVEGDKTGSNWVKILHIQERNVDRDVTKIDSKNKPYLSTYYEVCEQNLPPLRVSGYDSKPFAVPRWTVTGTEVWGTGPGKKSLPDVKQLQSMERDKLIASKKKVKPPLVGNSSSGELAVNASAGGVTWIDNVTQGQGPALSPLYQTNADINELLLAIKEVENRIKSTFFADLFFLIAQADKGNQTATEVIAKQKEKLTLLGPIIERLHPEFLRPIIERCFDIENQMGRLPEPPPEIQGLDIKIEIISQIKQAQELTVVAPIMEVAGAAQVLAQTWPDAADKFNARQALDVISNAHGVDPSIIFSDEEIAEKESAEQQELARQQALLETQAAIDSAKTLSETDTGGNNALTALTGGGAV